MVAHSGVRLGDTCADLEFALVMLDVLKGLCTCAMAFRGGEAHPCPSGSTFSHGPSWISDHRRTGEEVLENFDCLA